MRYFTAILLVLLGGIGVALATPLQLASELLVERQAVNNVCAQIPDCTTECLEPAHTGPTLDDCRVIQDTLRYIAQAGPTNTAGTGSNNTIVMSYRTCKSFFFNSGSIPAQYCRTSWADFLEKMVPECHKQKKAFGGRCTSPDQSWYIQFQHS
ncbi:hypothetical protein D9619_012405 [Psilocybe cf. subviscida]|uniref:Uncharacterized protein n=1 Tax=Psilocybe cf. subviscida TaxID=2480587 RepID=A0A8H5ASM6_9AGAR|nr:hypothetical protein D9619_012405 [Psilocybe cf. subviscida]